MRILIPDYSTIISSLDISERGRVTVHTSTYNLHDKVAGRDSRTAVSSVCDWT